MPRTVKLTLLSATLCLLFALVATVAWLAPAARAATDYPEPSPYPTTWELTFDYKTPTRIVVNVPGSVSPKAYWYMPYTLTNDGEETQTFIPQFEILTADGKVHKALNNVPVIVFDTIKTRERNKLMMPPTKVSGEIRPGVDQAKDSVAVWEEPSKDMDTFKIFVGGLSGEFVELKDDKGNLLKDAKGENLILRKTLQLTYHLNGDDVYPGEDPINEGEGRIGKNAKVWVMR
jgi:hypothetical protein